MHLERFYTSLVDMQQQTGRSFEMYNRLFHSYSHPIETVDIHIEPIQRPRFQRDESLDSLPENDSTFSTGKKLIFHP